MHDCAPGDLQDKASYEDSIEPADMHEDFKQAGAKARKGNAGGDVWAEWTSRHDNKMEDAELALGSEQQHNKSETSNGPEAAGAPKQSACKGFRAVQRLTAAALHLNGGSSSEEVPDAKLNEAILQLKPWEKSCFARWLANAMKAELMPQASSSRPAASNPARANAWLLRGLKLMEAGGGFPEAVALLVLLLLRMLRPKRAASSQTQAETETAAAADAGITQATVLLCLALRAGSCAAMGCLPKVLTAATQWAFPTSKRTRPLPKEQATQRFSGVMDFSACMLDTYRSNTSVKHWWASLQKSQGEHWVVALLVQRLASSAGSPALGQSAAPAELPSILRFCLTAGKQSQDGAQDTGNAMNLRLRQLRDLSAQQEKLGTSMEILPALPAAFAWDAIGSQLMAAVESDTGPLHHSHPELEQWLQCTALSRALLSNPKWLHQRLNAAPVHKHAIYGPLVAARAVIAGGFSQLRQSGGDLAAENTALVQKLLLQLTPGAAAISWLLLRLLLDEQVCLTCISALWAL